MLKNIRPVTMKAKDAADYLGISYWLILEMTKQGKIPFIACGGKKLFRKEALDKWMEQQEQRAIKSELIEDEVTSRYGTLRKIF